MTIQVCACGYETSELRCFQCGKLQAAAGKKFLLAYLRDCLAEELSLCTDDQIILFMMIYFPATLHQRVPSVAAIVTLMPTTALDRALLTIDAIRNRGL